MHFFPHLRIYVFELRESSYNIPHLGQFLYSIQYYHGAGKKMMKTRVMMKDCYNIIKIVQYYGL